MRYSEFNKSLIDDPVERARINDLKELYAIFSSPSKARYFASKGLLKMTNRQKELLYRMTDEHGEIRPIMGPDAVPEGWVRDTPEKFDLGIPIEKPSHTKAGAEANAKRMNGLANFAAASGKQPKLVAQAEKAKARYAAIADNDGEEPVTEKAVVPMSQVKQMPLTSLLK